MGRDTTSKKAERLDWKAVAKRTLAEFGRDQGTDLAAALTYYAMMSIAPMLLALSSMLGVFGQGDATTEAVEELGTELGLDESFLSSVIAYVDSMQSASGGGVLLVIGVLGSLWSASNYVNAFSRMMNRVYRVTEGRPVWVLRPWLLAVTVLIFVLMIVIVLSVTLSGSLASAIFGQIGLSAEAVTLWNWAKWPVLLLLVIGMIKLLYWGTPNVKAKLRWLSPGAAFGLLIALLAASGFGTYAANFGNYNATYGALGGLIVLLLAVWLINVALVLGAELDAAVERARELHHGIAAEEEVQLPMRGVKAAEKKEEAWDELVRQARAERMAAAGERGAGTSVEKGG